MSTNKDCGSRRIDQSTLADPNASGGPFGFGSDQVNTPHAVNVGHPNNPPGAIVPQPPGRCNCPPCLVLVELAGDLSMGQTSSVDDDTTSASASIIHYDRASNDYAVTSELAQITVHHALTDHNGSNIPIGAAPLGPGDRAWAYHNSQSNRWEILHQPNTTTRFELTANLTPGGNATAERVTWNAATYQYETNSEPFTVYDALCNFSSIVGCRGLARYWADSGRWEISRLDQLSTSCSSSSSS